MSLRPASDFPPLSEKGLAAIIARAEKGDPQAQRDLGCMYWWGEDLPKDDEKSRYWYTMAAERGHGQALYDAGGMYLAGEGGPVDVERGLMYLRRAASRRRWHSGATEAAKVLIEIYQNGYYGVAKDEEQATHWRRIKHDLERKKRGWRRCRGRDGFGITIFTAGQ